MISSVRTQLIKEAGFGHLPRIEGPGGEKYIPLSNLLDILSKRSMLLTEDLTRAGLKAKPTEFLRGQILILNFLQQVLREPAPGSSDPNL